MTSAQTWELSYQPTDHLSLGGPEPSQSVRRVLLNSGPESAKLARDFTRDTVADWQLDPLAYDAVTIASELVTNAIRHGVSPDNSHVELAWQRHASRLICVVTDRSAKPPVLVAAGSSAECGRGLQVVQALAATWGWMRLSAQEKAVWAALLLPLGSLIRVIAAPGASAGWPPARPGPRRRQA